MHTTVTPVFAIASIDFMTMAAERASRPEVGSSRKRRDGLDASSTAIVRRLHSDGDSVATMRPASGTSSSMPRTAVTCAARAAGVTSASRRSAAEKATASRTVAYCVCRSCCSQYADTRASTAGDTTSPFSFTVPVMRPIVFRFASTSISVLLPAPDAPISAVIVPGAATPDTERSSFLATFFPPGPATSTS